MDPNDNKSGGAQPPKDENKQTPPTPTPPQPPAGGTPVPSPPPPAGGTPVPPPQGAPVPPPQGGAYPPPQGSVPPPPGGAYPPPQGAPVPPPPGGAYPPPAGGAYPPPAGGAPAPEDTAPANFQLGTKLPPELKVKIPKNELKFDENHFIRLLACSISLSKDEKKKIIDSIPKLKQAQVNELIKIFEEEKQKFAALSKKHVPQLEKLAQQHYDEWMQLEDEVAQSAMKQEDAGKADEIRKNLGI